MVDVGVNVCRHTVVLAVGETKEGWAIAVMWSCWIFRRQLATRRKEVRRKIVSYLSMVVLVSIENSKKPKCSRVDLLFSFVSFREKVYKDNQMQEIKALHLGLRPV